MRPGVYVLGAHGPVDLSTMPARVGHIGFNEYHAPPADTVPLSVTSLAAPQYLDGLDIELPSRVVSPTSPDSVKVFVRATPAGTFQQLLERRTGGYEYAARIPAGTLRTGPHEFVIAVFNGDSIQTFPGGAGTKPGAWNYSGTSAWKFDVVNARSTLRLFDPGPDAARLAFTRIGDAGRRGLFRVALSDATGQPVFHLELPVDSSSGWSPPDYTASLVIKSRVAARQATITSARELRVRLRGLSSQQTLHVTLMEDDGTSWTAVLQVDSIWREQTVPLIQFTAGRGVLLPEGFPGDWNYWVEPAAGRDGGGDHVRLDHLERIQLSLRPKEGRGVEVEWAALVF